MAPDDEVTPEPIRPLLWASSKVPERLEGAIIPPDVDEDLEVLAYDLKTPEGVTRYVQNKLNQATAGFADQDITPGRRKMMVNAMRAELQKIADRLGYDDVLCQEDPDNPGALLLGLMNEPKVTVRGEPPKDDDSGGAA